MQLRVFIYKPGEVVGKALTAYVESLGHEAAVINLPQTCLQYHSTESSCSSAQVCADVIFLGPEVDPEKGLAMLQRRMAAGCPGARNNAIICRSLTDNERQIAKSVECQCFEGPLDLPAVGQWLIEVQGVVDKERELSPYTIGGTAA